MICETLAIDYDETIADPEPEVIPQAIVIPTEDPEEPVEEKKEPDPVDDESKHVMDVVSRYLARKLSEDIRHGTDISLDDLYHLLAMCKHAKELAEK